MEHVKHPTLAPEQLHGQSILEKKPPSHAPRQRGRLFVSEKGSNGSFILRLRPEGGLRSEDVVRTPTTKLTQADPDLGEIGSPEGRALNQDEVDRIRLNTAGERQLTGCALTLDVVRPWVVAPPRAGRRPAPERSARHQRPPR